LRRSCLILLVMSLVAPPAARGGDAPRLDGVVRLVPVKPAPDRLRAYALVAGVEPAAQPTVFAAVIGRATLHLADVDGNGRVDDVGVDGWCDAGAAYLLPFERPLLVGDVQLDVRQESDALSLRYRGDLVEAPAEHRAALRAVNVLRARNGVPPVDYDAALSEGCRLHCLYCDIHGLLHEEEAGKVGYTDAGALAGRNSNVALGTSLDRAGAAAFSTLYHRAAVMQPETRSMGFGIGKGHVAVDGLSRVTPRAWTWPLILPAPGSAGHPTWYDHTEQPQPVPPKPRAGLPVTLTWPHGTTFEKVEARMETARRHRAVAVHVSWPGHPAHALRPDNQDSICLIPAALLRPSTTYRVEVSVLVDGKPFQRTFEFTTGRR